MRERLIKWVISGWYVVLLAIALYAVLQMTVNPRLEQFIAYWYAASPGPVPGMEGLAAERQAAWLADARQIVLLIPVGLLLLVHLTGLVKVFFGNTGAADVGVKPVVSPQSADATLVRPAVGPDAETTLQMESTQIRQSVRLEPSGPRIIGPHDRYRVEKLLGSGGMGSVYRGFDQVLQRPVALKSLHMELAQGEPDQIARFRKEAHSLAGLSHTHIVPVYDLFEQDNEFWMVLEYLPGGDLDELIAKRRPTIKQCVSIIKAVAKGLEHAHSKGFVHRDVKPMNILFSEGHLPKLVDFGIAKGGQSEQAIARTQAGMSLGSPTYMSPEQALGQSDIDGRADIYSLGITFFKLLTGDVPFKGDEVTAVMLQHINKMPPAPSTLNAEVSPRLDAIVLKMLQKERDARYQTLAEFIADVDDYVRSSS